MPKKKLTFFAMSDATFMRPIILGLRSYYKVKTCISPQEKEFYQLYGDSDVAWFEWCDNFAASHSHEANPSQVKNVIRLHSYEMFTDMPAKVNWQKINGLIFVSDTVRDLCLMKYAIPHNICTVINNGVDISKFSIPKDKKYNKKVVFVGYINYKKGPELLMEAFSAIHRFDPEFTFHIAGRHQDERIKLYMDNYLSGADFKVSFDGWVDDMPNYLKNKDYVISTSLFESFQYSIAEGMAQGCVPLIHNWVGAKQLYPSEFIFKDTHDLVKIIEAAEKLFESPVDAEKMRQEVRRHIEKRFNINDKLEEIKSFVDSL